MGTSKIDLGGPWPLGWTPDTPSKDGLAVMRDVVHTYDGRLARRSGKADRYDNLQYASADYTTSYGAIYEPGLGHVIGGYQSSAFIGMREPSSATWLSSVMPSTSASATIMNASSFPTPYMMTAVDNQIYIADVVTRGYLPVLKWGGSNKAKYSTGTVDTTSGNTTITGTTTSWSANVEPGMYLHIEDAGSNLNDRMFRIVSVTSNTALIVDKAPDATVSGKNYSIQSLGIVSSNGDGSWAYREHLQGACPAGHQQRLFVADPYNGGWYQTTPSTPSRIRWSGLPTEGSGKYVGTDYFQANAYLDVAPGEGGMIAGMTSLGGQLVILKNNGVYALHGAVASDGSDNGQFLATVRRGVGANHSMAWANTPIGVAFLNEDGLHVYDGANIRNVMAGKCARYWKNVVTKNVGIAYWWVSCARDRIILTDSTSSSSVRTHLVYTITTDSWSTQLAPAMGRVVFDSDYGYEPCGARHSSNAGVMFDWASDLDESQRATYRDASVAGSNVPMIQTHAIPMSTGSNLRPVSGMVDGFVADAAGASSPTMRVKVYSSEAATTTNSYGPTVGGASGESQIAATNSTLESTRHRIRVSNARAGQSISIRVYQGDGASTPGNADYFVVNRVGCVAAPVGRVVP